MSEASAQAIVILGVTGSGKSTVGAAVATALGWTFCDGDDHHPPENVAKMSAGVPLTDEDRAPWLRALRHVIEACLDRGESVVLACSALKAEYRNQLLEDNDATLVYLRGDRALIEDRMLERRDHFMGPRMLDSQLAILEEPDGFRHRHRPGREHDR
jgi:gluconokinase